MYLKIPFRQKLMSKIYVRTLKDVFYVNTRTINLVYHIRVVSCLSGNTNDIYWSLVKQNDTKKYMWFLDQMYLWFLLVDNRTIFLLIILFSLCLGENWQFLENDPCIEFIVLLGLVEISRD